MPVIELVDRRSNNRRSGPGWKIMYEDLPATNPFFLRQEVKIMPGRKHLKGVSSKEQRQYEHIKESAQKSGRYGKRAKEVAARTVMKHHKEEGHAKGH